MSKINRSKLYSIRVEYYYSGMSAVVRTMDNKGVRFVFSPELEKLFEKEMNQALVNNNIS